MKDLYGGCATSGAAFKECGRVGDSPLIGSGLFVDNDVGAATATGKEKKQKWFQRSKKGNKKR